MEVCIDNELGVMVVSDGYNHRIQLIELPELQAEKARIQQMQIIQQFSSSSQVTAPNRTDYSTSVRGLRSISLLTKELQQIHASQLAVDYHILSEYQQSNNTFFQQSTHHNQPSSHAGNTHFNTTSHGITTTSSHANIHNNPIATTSTSSNLPWSMLAQNQKNLVTINESECVVEFANLPNIYRYFPSSEEEWNLLQEMYDITGITTIEGHPSSVHTRTYHLKNVSKSANSSECHNTHNITALI